MTSKLTLRPIRINTGSADTEGRLVLAAGSLVAILVRLDGPEHGLLRGHWLLEAGFGPCTTVRQDLFASLDDAKAWIIGQLTDSVPPGGSGPSNPDPSSRHTRERNQPP
jgi:hypothetical protein